MFGYVKPYQPELLVKEYEFYRAVYCGLCRSMKKNTGVLSNAFLNYDAVFLALARMAFSDEEPEAELRRCIAHPTRKRPMLKSSPAIDYSARAFASLAYYKNLDDIEDKSFFGKLTRYSIHPVIAHAKRLADIGELDVIVSEGLKEISALEGAGCAEADRPAEVFGRLLGEVFKCGVDGNDALLLYECGFHLGKFIYIADALDDYEKDVRENNYNPFRLTYGDGGLSDSVRNDIRVALILECEGIERAVDLFPEKHPIVINIIKNIIYMGLIKRLDTINGKGKTDERSL